MRVENNAGALHLAAAKGHDDIVQELLDAGIAPDMQTKVCVGRGCCVMACMKGREWSENGNVYWKRTYGSMTTLHGHSTYEMIMVRVQRMWHAGWTSGTS